MKKIAIVGAGISGLTLGRLLSKDYNVSIFETSDRPGGLVKCDRVEGSLFHTCGGHVFNTKNQKVLDLFWSLFSKSAEFTKADRNSVIIMPSGQHIPYPVEDHAYLFEDGILNSIIDDIINLKGTSANIENFKEFLLNRFGNTLYELYFRPYNEKIWRCDLMNIPINWLEGKLPMPEPKEILFNNIRRVEEKQFVHSSFWYENENGSQFLANRLSHELNIIFNTPVEQIIRIGHQWKIGENLFDAVIYTGSIKMLPRILSGVDLKGFSDEIGRWNIMVQLQCFAR